MKSKEREKMNWGNNFSQILLDRGYDYYLNDHVELVEKIDGGYKATVSGMEDYTVHIFVDGENVTKMDVESNNKKSLSEKRSAAGKASGVARRGKVERDPFEKLSVPRSLLADIDALALPRPSGKGARKEARWHVVRRHIPQR